MFVRYRKILQYITKLYDHTISYRIIPSYNILRKNNKIRLGRSKCDFYLPRSLSSVCGQNERHHILNSAHMRLQRHPAAAHGRHLVDAWGYECAVSCLYYLGRTTVVEPRWSNLGARTSVVKPRWSNLGFGRTSVLVEPRFRSNLGLGRTSV